MTRRDRNRGDSETGKAQSPWKNTLHSLPTVISRGSKFPAITPRPVQAHEISTTYKFKLNSDQVDYLRNSIFLVRNFIVFASLWTQTSRFRQPADVNTARLYSAARGVCQYDISFF